MLGTHIILDITVIRAPILVSKFVCGRAGHRKSKADLAFATPHLLQDNPSSFVLTDLAEVRTPRFSSVVASGNNLIV